MSLFKRITALVLCVVTVTGTVFFTGGAGAGAISSEQSVFQGDIPVITTDTILRIEKAFRLIRSVLDGTLLFGGYRNFEVTMSSDIENMCRSISEQSSLDVYKILTNLPDITVPADLRNKVLNIDTAEFREEMYELVYKYRESGDKSMATVCRLIAIYFSGVENAYIYLDPVEGDIYRINLILTYTDGGTETLRPDMYVNTATGMCYGADERGMLGLGFDCNYAEAMVYAPINCWMRSFGFCLEYDILCYLLPVYRYNTRRFKFDYAGKEWMMQIWKGDYILLTGAEAGMYNRRKGSVGSFYNCAGDDEMLKMSLQVWQGDKLIAEKEEMKHWWINAFRIVSYMASPDLLTLKYTVELPDEEMLRALCGAMDNERHHDVSYTADGLKLSVVW